MWLAVASDEWLGVFCLPSLLVADLLHQHTRAVHVLKLYPTPTTVFILPILLLLASCFYRTAHDLGLGLLLTVLHSELVLLQRRTAAATATAATATTVEETALGIAPPFLALCLLRRRG